MNTEILDESPLYHYFIQKANEKAIAQSIKLGEERGFRLATLIMLIGRYGDPTADVAEAISAADRETLQAILLNATTDTLAQVREQLGLPADEQPQP